jgi:hypothetical protein
MLSTTGEEKDAEMARAMCDIMTSRRFAGAAAAAAGRTANQGLTLVHSSAQLKRLLCDRVCS